MSEDRPPTSRSPLGDHLVSVARQDASWIVQLDDDTQKTLTTDQVVDAYNRRMIDPETYVWADGMRTWQQLQAVDHLVDALHARATDAPPSSDTLMHSTAVEDRCTAVEDQSASGEGRGGPIKETHEDSAIFSLAMLTSDQPVAESDDRTDDSGLIDLRAMMAAAEPAPQPPIGVADPISQPGLFHAPPPSAPATAAPAPVRDNRGLVIGLIAAIAVLSALLVFQVVRTTGESPETRTGSEPVATMAEEVPVVQPPSATPARARDVPAPPSSAGQDEPTAASTTDPSATKTPVVAPRTTHAARPKTKTPAKTTAPKTPKPAKAPSGGCQCAPGDLDCHMRCAVKK